MKWRSAPLLLAGYGVALAVAATLLATGAGLLLAVLAFWLGGAVATVLAGLTVQVAGARRSNGDLDAEDDPDVALRSRLRWESERRASSTPDAPRRADVA